MKTHNYLLLICSALLLLLYFFWWHPRSASRTTPAQPVLVVGTSADFPPFSFKKGDQIVGFDIDVVHEVARRLGKEIEIQDMPFETLLSAAQFGSIQVIAAGLSYSPERAKRLLFATSHYQNDPLVMVVRQGEPAYTINQLTGKRVLVNQGYVADTYVSALPGLIITRLKTVPDALMALQAGYGDVFVTAYSSIKPFFNLPESKAFTYHTIPGTSEAYALAISNVHPELHHDIDRLIKEMLEDGTIDHYKKTWDLST